MSGPSVQLYAFLQKGDKVVGEAERGDILNTQRERQCKAEEDLKVLALMIGKRQPPAKEEWGPS